MTHPLKGGYYASPAKHTNGTTAHIPPNDHYNTVGFRTFRPSHQPVAPSP